MLIGRQADKFSFCSKGIIQLPGYEKNLQNVPGYGEFNKENVNPY